jgi:hypothetical protein
MLAAEHLRPHGEPASPATNGDAAAQPVLASPSRSILRYVIERYPPELALRLLSFASTLPEDQARSFLDLLREVDDAATARAALQERAHWERLVAHLPGLAPALDLLRAHVRGTEPPCTLDGTCTLGT